jgi:RecA/RadA recombinase
VKAERSSRLGTGITELDRVLGGGLVPGSLVLLGGAPGIGKSTLAGMALANIAGAGNEVLYVSGEESAAQVRRRAERLGEDAPVPMLAEPSSGHPGGPGGGAARACAIDRADAGGPRHSARQVGAIERTPLCCGRRKRRRA